MPPFNLDACIEQLLRKQLLHEALLREICEKAKEVLMRESNVVHVSAPVTVVGDIHGQFYDLVEIFRIGGYAPHTNYLFLGDYVDRGLFSVETISLLTCLKLRYPDRVQLIRGNHESRAVTQSYGFYTECVRKYGSAHVWTYFTDMFDFLTLSVVIDDQIFCVHGGMAFVTQKSGLSPSIHSIDQIKVVDRFREIPHEGPMADLVWSDPDPDKEDFAISPRGAGYTFGSGVVRKFLSINNMSHILRAHQLCMEGFSVLFENHLSTVWSAPNYCYRCGNSASILEVGPGGGMHFNVFEAAPENDRDGPGQQQGMQNGAANKVVNAGTILWDEQVVRAIIVPRLNVDGRNHVRHRDICNLPLQQFIAPSLRSSIICQRTYLGHEHMVSLYRVF
ncbi:Metallo-dependent phosphatase [Sanghuangporus baumii]|uniref:Serine/threonine-protein phosphatase n=1 Tax=Sanghuangporus baumii TaxID=108892 RepID=A0A9Q5HX78_SANBA|nr:Metallo-dependent phosphatase [Sanghuangporus baumii]